MNDVNAYIQPGAPGAGSSGVVALHCSYKQECGCTVRTGNNIVFSYVVHIINTKGTLQRLWHGAICVQPSNSWISSCNQHQPAWHKQNQLFPLIYIEIHRGSISHGRQHGDHCTHGSGGCLPALCWRQRWAVVLCTATRPSCKEKDCLKEEAQARGPLPRAAACRRLRGNHRWVAMPMCSSIDALVQY